MADEKKPAPQDFLTSFIEHPDPFVQIVFMVLGLLIVAYLINGFLVILAAANLSPLVWFNRIYSFITGNSSSIWIVRIFAIIISVIFGYLIIYYLRKLIVLRKEEKALLYPDAPAPTSAVNPRWQRITAHSESIHENDWRQAIIEADIMLEELLSGMGLPGDSIGDKLKAVERGNFATLDNAWEAHKVRNRIAHDGSTFMLTQRLVRETIAQYESVFKEFKII
jgi:hypothetical protein